MRALFDYLSATIKEITVIPSGRRHPNRVCVCSCLKRLLPLVLLTLIFLLSNVMVTAETLPQKESGFFGEAILFVQVTGEEKTLYYTDNNGLSLVKIISGKELEVFSDNKYIFYFCDQQLYRFSLNNQKGEWIATFKEKNISINFLENTDELAQALILAKDTYSINYYIIDLSDNNIRRLDQAFNFVRSTANEISSISPNGLNRVKVKHAAKNRFEIIVEVKDGNKFKVQWRLPRNLTVIPELPVWAPDSGKIAFYAKEVNNNGGFYSLYTYFIGTDELKLIKEQVFAKLFFSNPWSEGFRPNWSHDARELLFEYLPYGLPTRSAIISYATETGKSRIVTESQGENQYPQWSPSGKQILFLSNRDNQLFQLYVMDHRGENLKQVSPDEGITEWAQWFD
ncbi:MAG TPA: hypothetical protein PLZ08_01030 [Bacillota bacterium]|jgi:Tol biopolymer transport system component|nr:hypothetical protein [Bacillota bacterium]HOL10882.1 hypothetical protein [Bacillota bacterium]HPO96525.1 hypothetical protein [Bacillota bacterium]